MEIASLVISIFGAIVSVIGVFLTIRLAGRTKRIENSLNDKHLAQLSLAKFNQDKDNYVKRIDKITKEKNNLINSYDEIIEIQSSLEAILSDIPTKNAGKIFDVVKTLGDVTKTTTKGNIQQSEENITSTLIRLKSFISNSNINL